ncbi:hypothetical protein PT974_08024 [Cladobotryum mycophilum]|uniref:Extracellular membrane protein CFEM domain-containing protein n=1 Tax=Cladobotryum mycophilum TaxID=491253 RepID=A0ABR0SCR2_9HYPO
MKTFAIVAALVAVVAAAAIEKPEVEAKSADWSCGQWCIDNEQRCLNAPVDAVTCQTQYVRSTAHNFLVISDDHRCTNARLFLDFISASAVSRTSNYSQLTNPTPLFSVLVIESGSLAGKTLTLAALRPSATKTSSDRQYRRHFHEIMRSL